MTALPAWVAECLAAAMLVLAAQSVARLARAWRVPVAGAWDVEPCHFVMALVMAAMFVGAPLVFPAAVWAGVFCAAGVWFARRVVNGLGAASRQTVTHYGPHLVLAGAMAFMLVTVGPMSVVSAAQLICGSRMLGMVTASAGGATPAPALVVGLLCVAVAIVVVSADRRLWTNAARRVALASALPLDPAIGAAGPPVAEVSVPAPLADATSSGAGDTIAEHEPPTAGRTRCAWLTGARAATGCHAGMAVAMGVMLVTMR